MPWRAKNRDNALRLPGIRRLRSIVTISSSVRSGCPLMRARIFRECFSKGEVLPPRGIGSQVPSSWKRCSHRIAELALTLNCSDAPRRDPPPSTNSITRILNSPGYGPCNPPANQCVRLVPSGRFGNPDSLRPGRAVVRRDPIGLFCRRPVCTVSVPQASALEPCQSLALPTYRLRPMSTCQVLRCASMR